MRMSDFGDFGANAALTATVTGTQYLGLFDSAPPASGDANEVTGVADFRRIEVDVTNDMTITANVAKNSVVLRTPDRVPADLDGTTVTHFGLFDTQSGTELVVASTLDDDSGNADPINLQTQMAVEFDSNDLTITANTL